MLGSYSSRHGVNVPVISFVTRRLIDGYKGEFTRRIEEELGVRIKTKTSDRPHVNIKGPSEIHIEAAKDLITQLDQKAQIIVGTNVLKTTGSVTRTDYSLLEVHLPSLLASAKRALKPSIQIEEKTSLQPPHKEALLKSSPPASGADIASETTPDLSAAAALSFAGDADIDENLETDAEWKPKPRALKLKFVQSTFTPRNLSQALTYLAAKDADNSYVYAAGPFGGGKTFTPLRAAFEGYAESRYDEIMIIRPSASTGRDPGAMPGNARSKMAPYLKGGIESNIEKIITSRLQELENKKIVRAFTPDFERGETYDHAFILVDEPQNLTMQQAELLVGRLGEGSVMVFAGDIGGKQNDLRGQVSGLAHLIATQGAGTEQDEILRDATAFIQFKHEDSAARNKILPHVSRALNEPPQAYADFMQAVLEVRHDSKMAQAIEGIREYAVDKLAMAARNTLFRYEKQIQDKYPALYAENREIFRQQRPALHAASKIA
ncbi:MAG: PhoH family protein [Micavibrio sp.]